MEIISVGLASVEHDSQWLYVDFDDGSRERFLGQWLQDNVASGRHQAGGQRTFDINTLPVSSIVGAKLGGDGVIVDFGSEQSSQTFTTQTFTTQTLTTQTFESEWLVNNRFVLPAANSHSYWDSDHQESLEFFDYRSMQNDNRELRRWLIHVRDYGYGLLNNVPTEPGSILDVVSRFGFTRETNYGTTFEVREEPDPSNLAFTKSSIGMHTDNPYRDPVPGLQLLHCLINESDGGETQLCDGFNIVNRLRQTHPETVGLLEQQAVTFRYLESGAADLQATFPMIETDNNGDTTGIRYNSRSIQTFVLPAHQMSAFYDAYRALGQALQDPTARIEFRLGPGQLMMFDNQRILHGRTGYKVGNRHLQGCYADKDSLNSTIRVLGE